MSGGAIMGAAVVGAGSSYMASKSASKSANAALASADAQSALQYEMGMEQLNFQKEQYDNWEKVFGPIQENLSSYYNNLTPDSYAAKGLQGLQQSYTTSKKSLEQSLAQRGIADSGVAAAAQAQLEGTRMMGGAQIRAGAQDAVKQQQSSFLGMGMGQQGALQSGIANSYGNLSNIYGQQAGNSMALQSQYSQQAAQANAGIGSAIGQGVGTYITAQAINKPTILNQQTGGYGIYGLDYI